MLRTSDSRFRFGHFFLLVMTISRHKGSRALSSPLSKSWEDIPRVRLKGWELPNPLSGLFYSAGGPTQNPLSVMTPEL